MVFRLSILLLLAGVALGADLYPTLQVSITTTNGAIASNAYKALTNGSLDKRLFAKHGSVSECGVETNGITIRLFAMMIFTNTAVGSNAAWALYQKCVNASADSRLTLQAVFHLCPNSPGDTNSWGSCREVRASFQEVSR